MHALYGLYCLWRFNYVEGSVEISLPSLMLYCLWRFNYVEGSVKISLTNLIPRRCCACSKTELDFQPLCLFMINDFRWEVIVGFVNIYVMFYHHCFYAFFSERRVLIVAHTLFTLSKFIRRLQWCSCWYFTCFAFDLMSNSLRKY